MAALTIVEDSDSSSRGIAAILGAVVADAASLGTHWIYSKAEVDACTGGLGSGGEFVGPVASYHKARRAGQGTMYGEGLLLMARSLVATNGALNEGDFLNRWKGSFGVCGTFVGYADGVTRSVVYNMMELDDENTRLTYLPSTITDSAIRDKLNKGVKAAAETLRGELLEAKAAELALECGVPEHASWVVEAACAWERLMHTSVAAKDNQSNTLGKLVPAAVAFSGRADFDSLVERAIRVTQDDNDAVSYFVPLARMIEAVVLGFAKTPRAAIDAGIAASGNPAVAARLMEAVALGEDSEENQPSWAVIQGFGASCMSKSTAPVTVFLLVRYGAAGFETAVRQNMVGDSASRACIIGAVLAALQGGPPAAWVAQLEPSLRSETEQIATKLVGLGGLK